MSMKKIIDPQQWNTYSYVRNNPLIYVDPDGQELNLWIVVTDKNPENLAEVRKAAPMIANDFHRWGVKQVSIHITAKFENSGGFGGNRHFVGYASVPAMTQRGEFGNTPGLNSRASIVNSETNGFATEIRNTIDHEVTHQAQHWWTKIFGGGHSSDPNDIMYANYNPSNKNDPEMSHDDAQRLRQEFNQAGDKEGTTITDDTQMQDAPLPGVDMLDAFATGIYGDVSPGLSPFAGGRGHRR